MSKTESTPSTHTTFDELYAPIVDAVESIEEKRTPHHRESLSFALFVRILIYYFVNLPKSSGRQLITDLESVDPALKLHKVKKSTFFDAFNRFPVAWFMTLFAALLASIAWVSIPELAALGTLYCIDGSLFPALSNMVWAEYKENKYAFKLHLCFELNRMIPVSFMLEAGNSSERDALRQMLQAGVTYIADRGYVCFRLLADIVVAEAHFVMRMKSNLVYSVSETLTVDVPDAVRHIFTAITDERVCLTNAAGKPVYRLVTFQAGKETYLILTDRLDLSTFQVILLYAYRWQVELLFRFLKRTMNGLHLLSSSQEGVTIQFYMILCAALLQLHFKQQCVAAEEGLPPVATPDDEQTISGLMIQPNLLRDARGQTFLATVGSKLHRYWKISIHWLQTLRNLLARPFNRKVVMQLNRY